MSNMNNKPVAPQGLKAQRARRQRINRMKTGIVLFIAVWMAICMGLNVFLLIRVSSLQNQIGIIAEKILERTQVNEESSESMTEDDIERSDEELEEPVASSLEEENVAIDPEEARSRVRSCIALQDNLRKEGDPMNVYLTFDDGPSENTPEILKILSDHNVKATFFVTGKESDEAKQWYNQIVAEGHTLGIHSYSHKYSTIYESIDSFDADFTELHDYLKEITGVDCKFYRFPGGSSNQVSNTDMNEFIDYLGERGMTYYDWNVVCGDATSQIYTADELLQNVMTDVVKYKNSVVLMHDASDKDATVVALEKILQELEALNANILPITQDSAVIHHNLS